MENDANIVEVWLRKDPARWVAGAAAGLFAGAIAMLFAMVLASMFGFEIWYPAKIPALPFLGASAMNIGTQGSAIAVGLVIYEGICCFFGIIFAHFTGTNSIRALLGMGFCWGCFSWIFIHNLFTPAFRDVFVNAHSSGVAFFVYLVYGLSLVSVAYFDRIFRRS